MSEVIIERTVRYRIKRPLSEPLNTISWDKIIHATQGPEIAAEIQIASEDRELQIMHVESSVYQHVSEQDIMDEA